MSNYFAGLLPKRYHDSSSETEDAVRNEEAEKGRDTKRRRVQPSGKQVRGKRGGLKGLVEMNFDILHEIFGHLDPIDLLHLTWTCQMTRSFLMNAARKTVWKAARSNISGLPDCPDDLNEAQYANLAFGKTCYVCLRNLGRNKAHTIWEARVRVCTKCIVLAGFKLLPGRGYYADLSHGPTKMAKLRKLIPYYSIEKPVGRERVVSQNFVFQLLDLKWQEEFKKAEDSEAWLSEEFKKQQAICTHSTACVSWFSKYQESLEERKLSIEKDRVAVIEARLRAKGWGAEIQYIASLGHKIWLDPAIVKASQRELTERILQNVELALDAGLTHYRAERLLCERKLLLDQRLPFLWEVVKAYKLTISPTLLRSISEISSVTRTSRILSPTRMRYPTNIKDKLLARVQADCGPDFFPEPSTVLRLATTTFSCEVCHSITGPIRYPQVLVHACATKYDDRHCDSHGIDHKVLGNLTGKTAWNQYGCITFDDESRKVLTDVLVLCGYDPKTTTVAEMDATDPILECISCNSEHFGRLPIRWFMVPQHVITEHKAQTNRSAMNLLVLDDQEAALVRIRMNEIEALKQAHPEYKDLACAHCFEEGNAVGLRHHIKKAHGIIQLSETDIVSKLDSNRIQSNFRLWPPRKDETDGGAKNDEQSIAMNHEDGANGS